MEFFTGALVGEGGSVPPVAPQTLDVFSFATRAEVVDTLRDSIAFYHEAGFKLHEAGIFKCDLDGNNELVEVLPLDQPAASQYRKVVTP